MLIVSADEHGLQERGSYAMTPLTRSEERLLIVLEEAHLLAGELGINVNELHVPWALRVEAWLWRSSKLLGRH